MKKEKLSEAIGYIDDSLIIDAAENRSSKKRKAPIKLIVAAASFLIVLTGVAVFLPKIINKETPLISGDTPVPAQTVKIISANGIERNYKSFAAIQESRAIVWRWEHKTIFEKYLSVKFNGKEYDNRGREINAELLGEKLGEGDGFGHDIYEEKDYTERFEVYSIKDMPCEYLVAVKMEEKYYVCDAYEYDSAKTLASLIDTFSLSETLALKKFSAEDDSGEESYYALNDDSYIWNVLRSHADVLPTDEQFFYAHERARVTFTLSSEKMGVYKVVMYITKDGYLWTNLFDHAYIYYIGEDAAADIMNYAKGNAQPAESEPYVYSLAGVVTEIGDGYFILDDTSLCVNEADGMRFKISTKDIRIRRSFEFESVKIDVGTMVIIYYDGIIHEGNFVDGAFSISKGRLVDGDILIPA